jgi:alpha-amylase
MAGMVNQQEEHFRVLNTQSRPIALQLGNHNTAIENPTVFQGFEWYVPADHKHWQRLEKVLPSLASLGITSMWIPPACKASWYTGNGYDTYDLYDLGEFDQKGARHTKWGTKEELVAMSERAEQLGITILFDAVLNHKAAADHSEEVVAVQVDPKSRFELVDCGERRVVWLTRVRRSRRGHWGALPHRGLDWL